MNFRQTQIRLGTAFLGFLFLASMTLKTGHMLMLEHSHHAIPVCADAGHKNRAVHLHDERYNPDSCSICAFLFSIPELVPVGTELKPPPLPVVKCPIAPVLPSVVLVAVSTHLRGPPEVV